MIGRVGVSANVDLAADPAARVAAFAARLRRRHRRRAAEAAAVRAVLALAVPAIAGMWFLPTMRAPIALLFAAFVAMAAAAAALGARRTADAALLRGDGAAALAGVGDELATWLEQRRLHTGDAPMVGWLGRTVDARLPRLPRADLANVGRRRLGRWRRLVPIVLVLLLTWLIAEWLAPPWPGVAGGGDGGARSAAGGAGGGGADPGESAGGGARPEPAVPDSSDPPDQPPPERPDPTRPPPPTPPSADEPPPVEPEAPAPLLQLPEQQRFVVPEFVGDGPTRRARMHAAELAQRGHAPRATAGADGAAGEAPAVPPPSAVEFERAAEAAQRARHVPAEERPMVRRFFELLREAAK